MTQAFSRFATKTSLVTLGISLLALGLTACGSTKSKSSKTATLPSYAGKAGSASSVNRYLWNASLETLNFMPIFSADPIAGIIISDWYGNPSTPNERFKTNVFILDTALRADALRVSVFKQQLTPAGWIDAQVNPATARELENAILTRARELRLNSIGD